MNHEQLLRHLLRKAVYDDNTLGFFVFGSVASGTYTDRSDLDIITIVRSQKPSSGLENAVIGGIKVGNFFLTEDVFLRSISAVPYLLYPLVSARLLFDRRNSILPMQRKNIGYFEDNPEIKEQWVQFYTRFRDEKARFGYEQNTIIDVWNELEQRYSGGKVKRPFFNSIIYTNTFVFSCLKRIMVPARNNH